MRTNVVLNDELMQEAFRYSTATTKRALLEEALRVFVELRAAERQRETYTSRLAALQRKTERLRFRESPAALLRADRDRA